MTINEVTYVIHDLLAQYDINSEDIDIVFRCKKSKIKHRLEECIKIDWPTMTPPSFYINSFQMNGVKVILSDYDTR